MARIKRPGEHASNGVSFTQLGIGMALGAFFMYLYLGLPSESPTLLNDEKAQLLQPEKGWSTVNVYYGDSKLGASPTQTWFAQVHQDEIVLDLIGDNGYFIDLAGM